MGDIEFDSTVPVKGGITKVTTRDVRTPKKLNMASGKDSRTACAFSDQNWGDPTRKLTAAAKRRTLSQLEAIVKMACNSAVGERDPDSLSNAESDDEYALICTCLF